MSALANRRAYIAEYPDDETECVLFTGEYWNDTLSNAFDRLCAQSNPHKIMAWYCDSMSTVLLGVIGKS